MNTRLAALGGAALLLFAPQAHAQQPLEVVSRGPAVQARSEQFVVRSARTGRDYLIQVTPPFTPPLLPGQKAAAVYALDGGYGIVGPAGWLLGGTSAMQPAYMVTIGYAPGGPGGRDIDLLFGPGTRPDGSTAKGGGGEAFTAFLLEELRPFVEAQAPVDPKRSVLFGHSLSGVFAANLLQRRPDAFAGYLIASPSVWADPGLPQRLAAVPASASPPKVFVAYGEEEEPHMVEGGRRVAEAVAANRAAFASRAHVFAGAEHVAYYPELVRAGLGWLLPRAERLRFPPEAKMSPAELRRYEGTYAFSDGRTVQVALRGDRLFGRMAGAPPVPLSAAAPGRFFVNGVDVKLAFTGQSGPADAVTLQVNGAEARAERTAAAIAPSPEAGALRD